MNARTFLTVVSVALFSLSQSLLGADASPSGTWKWTVTNPNNSQTRDFVLKLKQEGDKLTGTLQAGEGKEVAIEEASLKEGQVTFSITRERNSQKVTTKYSGKVDVDTITGKAETPRPNGQLQVRDWTAKREKA